MITSKTLRTVTDMRKDADGLLESVSKTRRPIGILRSNKLEAYLIDAQTLESLESFVENFLDYQTAQKRLEKSTKKDFQDFGKFWEKHGLPK